MVLQRGAFSFIAAARLCRRAAPKRRPLDAIPLS
jgi:hypothetical protein